MSLSIANLAGSALSVASPVAAAGLSRLEQLALNPQPLPPRDGGSAPQHGRFQLSDDWCGTVPRRFPPGPPPPIAETFGLPAFRR